MSDLDLMGNFMALRISKFRFNWRRRKPYVEIVVILAEKEGPKEYYLTLFRGDTAYFSQEVEKNPPAASDLLGSVGYTGD